MDIDEEFNADLLKSANDSVRRALDAAAAGESTKSLAMVGATALIVGGIIGFVVSAVAIKVLK